MHALNGRLFEAGHPQLAGALRDAYVQQRRPMCQCRQPGVEMYIARLGERFVIKRMPNSGYKHAASCDSFDPPSELSGRGELLGGAICTNADDGRTTLKLDFAMAKTGPRLTVRSATADEASARAEERRLTCAACSITCWTRRV